MNFFKFFKPYRITVFCVLLTLIFNISAFGAGLIDSVSRQTSDGRVSLNGTLPSGQADRDVSIEVVYKADNDTKNYKDSTLIYLGQTGTAAQGKYSDIFSMNGHTGLFTVRVKSGAYYAEYDFEYLDETQITTLLGKINNESNPTEIKKLLNDNMESLGIASPLYAALLSENADLSRLYGKIAPKTFGSIVELQAFFAENLVYSAVSAGSSSVIGVLLDSQPSVLTSSPWRGEYTGLSAAQKTEVQSRMSKKSCANDADLITLFAQSVLLTEIKGTERYSQLREFLNRAKSYEAQNAVLKLDLSKYNNQDYVEKALTGVDFPNAAALQTAIDAALASNSGTQPTIPPGNGTISGGGGGGGGGNITRQETYIPPDNSDNSDNSDVNDDIFRDVPKSHWAYDNIAALKEKGIAKGNEGSFFPEENITREEFTALIIRAFNFKSDGNSLDFSDVSADAWYFEIVASAYANGIINGTDENLFGAGRYVTREEIAAIAYRTLNKLGLISETNGAFEFVDLDDVSSYAREPINALVSLNVINGFPDGSFMPRDYATRAQAAKIIGIMLNLAR